MRRAREKERDGRSDGRKASRHSPSASAPRARRGRSQMRGARAQFSHPFLSAFPPSFPSPSFPSRTELLTSHTRRLRRVALRQRSGQFHPTYFVQPHDSKGLTTKPVVPVGSVGRPVVLKCRSRCRQKGRTSRPSERARRAVRNEAKAIMRARALHRPRSQRGHVRC